MALQRWIYFFLILALAYFGSLVFIPLFLSIFSAILLEPMVNYLVRKKFSRYLATSIVISGFLISSCVVVWLISVSISNLALDMSGSSDKITQIMAGIKEAVQKLHIPIDSFSFLSEKSESIQKVQVVEPYPVWTQFLLRGVGSVFGVMSVALFVPLLLFCILSDKDNLIESLNSLIGKYFYLPKLNSDLPKMIRAFFLGNVITALVLIFAHGFILYCLGFSNWASLAIITGVLNLIPLIGAALAIILPLMHGLDLPNLSYYPFILMVIGFLGIHFLSINVILPYLIGSKINVNSTALIFGLLFWGWLWGAMGFLLAIPMTALIKIFLESDPETVPLANLLAAKPKRILTGRL